MAAVKVPQRMGQGYAGLARPQSDNMYSVSDVMNQIAQNLEDIVTSSQLTNFAAFKAAMGALDMLEKSDDSRI